ncbi:MAG: hypothetical protein ABGY75_11070 [Gemmataceae bacterium]
MSRAYRIRVKESSRRELKGADEICTDLEVLEILPPEQMSELLKKELKEKGFAEQDGKLVRKDGDVTITVDPKTCEVTVRSEVGEEVTLEAERTEQAWDDVGPGAKEVRERAQKELAKDLDRKAKQKTEQLEGKATEQLEKKLCDLQPELSEVVNRVTREALKQKAQQLGTVKEIAEDDETGSLTIKVEV